MRVYQRGRRRVEVEVVGTTIVTRTYLEDAIEDEARLETSNPLRAKWDADRLGRARERDGFERISAAGEGVMLGHDEFEAALASDPDNEETYSVYADWLAERGDVWGELMSVQRALAALPRFGASEDRDRLTRHQVALLFKHSGRFWGWLGETIADEATQVYLSDAVDARWHLGFVREASIQQSSVRGLALDELIAALAELPIMRLVSSLSISGPALDEGVIAALAAPRWPALRALVLSSDDRNHGFGEQIEARGLLSLCDGSRAPRLAELSITGLRSASDFCVALADSGQAKTLTSIELRRADFSELAIAALASDRFASLERLTLAGTGLGENISRRLRPGIRARFIPALNVSNDGEEHMFDE